MTPQGSAPAVSAQQTLAEVAALEQRFGDTRALAGISTDILAGTLTGVVGPDGAGKTTLLRLLAGLLRPAAGRVTVLGHSLPAEQAPVHARIGYMPQRFGLYEDLTVGENLNLYAELRGLPPAERADTFAELLGFTGLEAFTERLAGKLSGGMKQKLGLACALLRKPELLLLDEPSVGVDPVSRQELWRMVSDLTAEGIGVVWSTAYLDEAERCDRVLLLNRGEALFEGPPDELTARIEGRAFQLRGLGEQRRRALAAALNDTRIIDGVVQGSAVRLVFTEEAVTGRADASDNPSLPDAVRAAAEDLKLTPVPPRFEDAFVDILGGGPGGRSTLAEQMPALPRDGEPVIRADNLSKRFGEFTAAEGISFEIPRGEIFGLLGPNGAGKSTTFKMLCGLLPPSGGQGTVAGYDLRRAAAQARSRLGYMAQKFSLYGDLSVQQNLAFFAGAYGLSRKRQQQQMATMVDVFDLGRHRHTAAKDLPLGFKQRLALACAVMHEPEILFLDEPTSGVDPLTRREFWTHINGLVEKGVTILVTTHFMDEAEYCDRIALMQAGKLVATDSPDALKQRAATEAEPDPTLEQAFIALVQPNDPEDD